MNGNQAKPYSFSKTNRHLNIPHEAIAEDSNSLTAQKKINLQLASNHLLLTNHSNTTNIRKKLVVPATLNKLSQLQFQFIQNQSPHQEQDHSQDPSFTTYVVIARILSIDKEMNEYSVVCTDGTPNKQQVILYSKKHHPQNMDRFLKQGSVIQQQVVQQLQFQPSTVEGHPYFKLWVKLGMDVRGEEVVHRWLIEKVSSIKDYNEITYHWGLVMMANRND